MRIETLKKMFDACYQAKRARDLLPPLPDGVTSSYIHYLDAIQILEKQEIHVKVSDISDALNLPRPGVTRNVKEMETKGYLQKIASPDDGRVTYIVAVSYTHLLWRGTDTGTVHSLCFDQTCSLFHHVWL